MRRRSLIRWSKVSQRKHILVIVGLILTVVGAFCVFRLFPAVEVTFSPAMMTDIETSFALKSVFGHGFESSKSIEISWLPANESRKMICSMFFNEEFDMLEIHLLNMFDACDKIVLLESGMSFQEKPKQIFLERIWNGTLKQNEKRWKKYIEAKDKVFIAPPPPWFKPPDGKAKFDDFFDIEALHRNYVRDAINVLNRKHKWNISPRDWIQHSDTDEIISGKFLNILKRIEWNYPKKKDEDLLVIRNRLIWFCHSLFFRCAMKTSPQLGWGPKGFISSASVLMRTIPMVEILRNDKKNKNVNLVWTFSDEYAFDFGYHIQYFMNFKEFIHKEMTWSHGALLVDEEPFKILRCKGKVDNEKVMKQFDAMFEYKGKYKPLMPEGSAYAARLRDGVR